MQSTNENASKGRSRAEDGFRSILDKRHGLVFASGAISIFLALVFGDQEVGLPLILLALAVVADFVMGLTEKVLELSDGIRGLREESIQGLREEISTLRAEVLTSADAYSKTGRMMKALEGTSLINEEALVSFVEGIEAFDQEAKEPDGAAGNETLAGSLVQDAINSRLDHWIAELAAAAKGDLVSEGEDDRLLVDLTNRTRKSIRATSVESVDSTFWESPQGRQYLAAQLEAKKSRDRFSIERIFIFDDDRSDPDSMGRMNDIMNLHEQYGVDVRIGFPTARLDVVDFIVFDESVIYQLNLDSSPGGGRITRTMIFANNETVRDRIRLFESWKVRSETLGEWRERVDLKRETP